MPMCKLHGYRQDRLIQGIRELFDRLPISLGIRLIIHDELLFGGVQSQPDIPVAIAFTTQKGSFRKVT